jgi:hypothetical protein
MVVDPLPTTNHKLSESSIVDEVYNLSDELRPLKVRLYLLQLLAYV